MGGRKRDAGETRFFRRSKLAKTGDKFIEWPPPREGQSPDPPSSRLQRPDRRKMSDNTELSLGETPTGTASTNWFPTTMAGSSDPSSGQCRHNKNESKCLEHGNAQNLLRGLSNQPLQHTLHTDSGAVGVEHHDDDVESGAGIIGGLWMISRVSPAAAQKEAAH
jgi:hypothetical protein